MSSDLRNSISSLLEASAYFNVSDLLVNTDPDKRISVELKTLTDIPKEDVPPKLIREAETTLRESGINSLCIVTGFVFLELGSKRVQTPLILSPVEYTLDKVRNVYSFVMDEDSSFLNPFLIRHVTNTLGIALPAELIESTCFETWSSFLSEHSLVTTRTAPVLGNFHHHRFSVIKELEELLQTDLSPALLEVLGEGAQATHSISLSPFRLFPSDTDHDKVFDTVKQTNTVIQGPPGTGKSQVLTNLVAKALAENSAALVISEKFAALEVIQKKLDTFQLGRLCTISTSKKDIKAFLLDLKHTWGYFETLSPQPVQLIQTSVHLQDNLQMTMDLLSQDDLVGGISFSKYQLLRSEVGPTNEYVSNVPELVTYLEECEHIRTIYADQLESTLGRCKPSFFQNEKLVQLDEKIRFWLDELGLISAILGEPTWSSVSETMHLSSQLQIFENDLFQTYHRLLRPDSREQNRYLKLARNYTKLMIRKGNLNHTHWKVSPSASEVHALLSSLSTANYFQRRKLKKRWQQLSEVPFEHCLSCLQERQQELTLEEEISQIQLQFCDLGIDDPEKQLPLIAQTLPHFTHAHWEAYASVSAEHRDTLTQLHSRLHTLYREFRTYFNFKNDDPLIPFLTQLNHQLPLLIQHQTFLKTWDSSLLHIFQFAASYEAYASIVVHSHTVKFEERFPQLAKFQPGELAEKIQRVIHAEDDEARRFAVSLEQNVRTKFQEAHDLLNTPARNLTPFQKSRKARLKKGKSILVKEFSKTRQHPTLRQLFQSEAREWIQLLKPIWLSNPSQLADCFPMEQAIFDLVIFDEASQIPLQNALGALQRSRRAVVAGDEFQMGPTSYFVARESETVNLLHQASYYFPKIALKHHYRSAHADLIAFSNHHFYGNSLQVFPNYHNQGSCLTHHYIEAGVFENRVNTQEAQEVAFEIERQLNEKHQLGIVAFSEEQLNCIWNQLSVDAQDTLNDLLLSNAAFFKALENVQGDECDRLIISFGYGKNSEGEFHHRFGPMNTLNGRKRLNVLLTRARVHIDFFCSVQSEDFKLSENESINLIRQWIRFSENYVPQTNSFFPFKLSPTMNGNTLQFSEVYATLKEAKELVTIHRVLSERGWECAYA